MGTSSLSTIVAQLPAAAPTPALTTALLLILVGAFTKSAQFPFHFWLPNAMAAPTPVSAYLHSATMVKLGVFLLARLDPGFGEWPLWEVCSSRSAR
jgi:multicomponent Na+:H+ antiporter subunit A